MNIYVTDIIHGVCIYIHTQETQKYKDGTEDRKMRFEALKKKDEGSSRLIAKQMKRLKKLQVCLYKYKCCVCISAGLPCNGRF